MEIVLISVLLKMQNDGPLKTAQSIIGKVATRLVFWLLTFHPEPIILSAKVT